MEGKYGWSGKGEIFQGVFDTREEAVKDALSDDGREGQWFETGQYQQVAFSISVDDVLDNLNTQASEEAGEAGDGIFDGLPDGAQAELEEKLDDLLGNWMEKYKLDEAVFAVVKVESHIEGEDEN